MVTTGGAEGETKRKRKFVARTEGRKPEGKRKKGRRERKRKRERRWKEKTRDTGYPFMVDLFRCRRGFPFLCVHASLFRYFVQFPAPKNSKASHCSSTPSLIIYIRDVKKLWTSRDRYSLNGNDQSYKDFLLKKRIQNTKSIKIIVHESNDIAVTHANNSEWIESKNESN